jgi:hypothetical protein
MTQRKHYNPNTKYGRRKLREQAANYRANLSPEERAQFDTYNWILLIVIVIIICGILYAVGGWGPMLKWLSR